MFSLFGKKTSEAPDLSFLKTDMHSHLIPGIDDGSPDMETSIELIQGLSQLGYKRLVTTPHVISGMYNNTREIILQGCEDVKNELTRRNIKMEFRAAAEYLLDDHFDFLLEKQEPLLTIKDNLVLVEFSFVSPPIDFKEKLFSIQINGYRPILAHPERYGYFYNRPTIYEELKNAGCLFQVNLLSLSGYYGKQAANIADQLIKKQLVDLFGTDMHHVRHLHQLQDPLVSSRARKAAATSTILNSEI
ncbi:MAG: histidinol phosphatase [Bacteroidetes bacterium]|nr:MAG: histidinol phosphatase [Bacteroidota bacterium]